jgi:D-serine deaminase-like pyridoxal phosphate-dependent protein
MSEKLTPEQIDTLRATIQRDDRELRAMIEADPALGALADQATAAAQRMSDAIDETMRFVAESNQRIAEAESKAANKISDAT